MDDKTPPTNFLLSETGQIIYKGIHDTSGAKTNIQYAIKLLKIEKENGTLTDELFVKYLDAILESVVKIEDSLDYVFEKLKEKEIK